MISHIFNKAARILAEEHQQSWHGMIMPLIESDMVEIAALAGPAQLHSNLGETGTGLSTRRFYIDPENKIYAAADDEYLLLLQPAENRAIELGYVYGTWLPYWSGGHRIIDDKSDYADKAKINMLMAASFKP